MIRRSAVAALAVLFLASCEMTSSNPTAPDGDPSAQFAISDGANEGNPFFFFLPPMVKDPDAGGVFDGTRSPVVKICRLTDIAEPDGGSCVTGSDWAEFTMSTGIQVSTVDEQYHVNWDTDGVAYGEGVVYRIRVYESDADDAELLGFADVAFPGKGQAKKLGFDTPTIALNDGRTLPIKFRIEEFAYLWEECVPDPSGGIQDCDVRFVPAGAPGTAFVEDPVGMEFAAEVRTPPIGEPVLLTLVLLPNSPPVPDPEFPQLPYFVDVTAVNAAGQPVDFGAAGGAELTLCQLDGLDPHPDYDETLLRLFRVDDGGPPQIWEDFELTDACYPTAPGVALFDSHGHPTGHSRFDVLMDRGKRALASLLLPQPLHAVHGGLNGRGIGDFSTWGATLVAPPPVTTFAADFETPEVPGDQPAFPPTGVTYNYLRPTEIFIRSETEVANQFAALESDGEGNPDPPPFEGSPWMMMNLASPPTTGEYMVTWRAQPQSDFDGGPVTVRDAGARILGTMSFGAAGVVRVDVLGGGSTTIGTWTAGVWQDYGMLINLDAREVTYYVAGAAVHGPVGYYEGTLTTSQIGRISMELCCTTSQTFWWDDVVLTEVVVEGE